MLAKVEVNGAGEEPLFGHLKKARRGLLGTSGIKWNFTKFLVGRDGEVIDRFAPAVRPAALGKAVDAALAQPA